MTTSLPEWSGSQESYKGINKLQNVVIINKNIQFTLAQKNIYAKQINSRKAQHKTVCP